MSEEGPLLGARPPVTHSESASKGLAEKVLPFLARLHSPLGDQLSRNAPPLPGRAREEGQGLSKELPVGKGRRQVSPKGGGINSRWTCLVWDQDEVWARMSRHDLSSRHARKPSLTKAVTSTPTG